MTSILANSVGNSMEPTPLVDYPYPLLQGEIG